MEISQLKNKENELKVNECILINHGIYIYFIKCGEEKYREMKK